MSDTKKFDVGQTAWLGNYAIYEVSILDSSCIEGSETLVDFGGDHKSFQNPKYLHASIESAFASIPIRYYDKSAPESSLKSTIGDKAIMLDIQPIKKQEPKVIYRDRAIEKPVFVDNSNLTPSARGGFGWLELGIGLLGGSVATSLFHILF